MKTEHILVIRFSAMGDVAMTVPVVYSLAKQYPHVRITVLSRPFASPFTPLYSPLRSASMNPTLGERFSKKGRANGRLSTVILT